MADETPAAASREHPLIKKCMQQLQEYFDGKRTDFDLPLQQEGSAFQQSVWAVLNDISYGKTVSYLELSKRIGNAKAIRAVGITNSKKCYQYYCALPSGNWQQWQPYRLRRRLMA